MWNNNSNLPKYKYALRTNIIHNSIQETETEECTNFEGACSSLLASVTSPQSDGNMYPLLIFLKCQTMKP